MAIEDAAGKEGIEGESGTVSTRKLALPATMLVVGLLAGGLVGSYMAGPMLVKRAFPGGVPAAMAAEPPDSEGSAGLDTSTAPRDTHLIENLIVNPAGTQGTRFLLLSIAFEATDGVTHKALEQRDLEVRDAILELLGSETVSSLSDVSNREAVKTAVRNRVQRLIGRESIGRIYFSQYVIQ